MTEPYNRSTILCPNCGGHSVVLKETGVVIIGIPVKHYVCANCKHPLWMDAEPKNPERN